MHAVAVVFDFVEPLLAFRRRIDQLGQLRPDPLRQRDGRHGACLHETDGSFSAFSDVLTLPIAEPFPTALRC